MEVIEHYKNLSLEDIPGEIWREAVGWEGLYQVSSMGRIKCYPRGKNRPFYLIFKSQTYKEYPKVGLSRNGKQFPRKVHRLVATAFIPNPENKPQVNHKNGIRWDNRVENLEWATNSENQIHSYKILGTKPSYGNLGNKGSLNSACKKVYQYTLDGEFIKEWESLRSAICFYKKSVDDAIRNKTTACGFKWSFTKDGLTEDHKKYLGRYPNILQYDINDNFIKEWSSSKEIQKELNLNPGKIGECCRGKRKNHGKFKWKYKISI